VLGHRLASRETDRVWTARFQDGIAEGERRARARELQVAQAKVTMLSQPGPKAVRRAPEPTYLVRLESWPQNHIRREVAGD